MSDAPATDPRFIRRLLPVALTAEEKEKIGDQLIAKLTEIDIVDADKREHIAKKNKELKTLRDERDRLRKNYATGAEEREVDCIERPGPNGTIELVRTDTGEVIDTEEAEEGDDGEHKAAAEATDPRQPALPFDRPGKACDGCSMADGNHHSECLVAHPEKDPERAISKHYVGIDFGGERHELTEAQAADVAAGIHVEVNGVTIDRVEEIPAEEPPAESDEDDDYAEAAAVADEQEANGETPEREVDEAIANGAPLPKKKRGGRVSAVAGGAE